MTFNPRKGGSRKTVDLKNDETLEPFSVKEIQAIFKVSHQTIAERKRWLGIKKDVGWDELKALYLLHVFVSSSYPYHTYYQFQSLYYHCLNNGLSVEIEVFEKVLMLDIKQQLQEFKNDVIQRIREYRKQNKLGSFRVVSELTETPNPDGATKAN